MRAQKPSRSRPQDRADQAGTRAFSLTSLVAQRDAGIGRWTLRAAASYCALAAWAAAAGSAVAFPGMAACRVPARWMIQG